MNQSRAPLALWRRAASILLAAVLCAAAAVAALVARAHAQPDNPPSPDTVGTISGDAISVQGPMSVDSTNGQFRTILRSGSDVQVKSGTAHIDLVEGGNITICGPAHFSVLKSGGALTIALDSGTIHAHTDAQPTLTIYTAQIQAHPVAIGGAGQDTLFGLDAAGTMCIRANKGAVRIEQQLTGQSLLIPQNGDVSIANGQLESLQTTAGRCACELQLSAKPPAVVTEVSTLASSDELKKKAASPKAAKSVASADPPATSEPVYEVIMPPLQYDAKANVQQEYDPKFIVLVRRARIRPTLIFQGKVEGEAIVAQSAPPAPPKVEEAKKAEDETTWNRVRIFFHKLWSPSS